MEIEKITLLAVQGVLNPEMSKKNIYFPFGIENKLSQLNIHFDYFPKILEDEEIAQKYLKEAYLKFSPEEKYEEENAKSFLPLLNLVTISLDCNGEYLGAAHRHMNEQNHIISDYFASPGFYKTKIERGIWQIVLNVHAVVTKECRYNLTVEGE